MKTDWTLVPALFLAGSILGSFISALSYRLPRSLPIAMARSQCPHCGDPIRWFHNIPLWGFLVLRGKCASCSTRISWRYPLLETASGLLIVLLYAEYGWSLDFVRFSVLSFVLLALSVIDHDFKIIPDRVTYPTGLIGFLFSLAGGMPQLYEAMIGGLVGGLGFWTIRWIGSAIYRREAMGLGDVKLAAVLGIFLGYQILLAGVLFGFGMLTIVGWIRIVKNPAYRRQEIPLAPYLMAGTVAALFFGRSLIHWYIHYLMEV